MEGKASTLSWSLWLILELQTLMNIHSFIDANCSIVGLAFDERFNPRASATISILVQISVSLKNPTGKRKHATVTAIDDERST